MWSYRAFSTGTESWLDTHLHRRDLPKWEHGPPCSASPDRDRVDVLMFFCMKWVRKSHRLGCSVLMGFRIAQEINLGESVRTFPGVRGLTKVEGSLWVWAPFRSLESQTESKAKRSKWSIRWPHLFLLPDYSTNVPSNSCSCCHSPPPPPPHPPLLWWAALSKCELIFKYLVRAPRKVSNGWTCMCIILHKSEELYTFHIFTHTAVIGTDMFSDILK